MQDADIPVYLKDVVYIRQLSCEDPVEKLYYSAKFADICVHCGVSVEPWSDKEAYYPQNDDCRDRRPIPNTKKSQKSLRISIFLVNDIHNYICGNYNVMNNGNGPPARIQFPGSVDGNLICSGLIYPQQ